MIIYKTTNLINRKIYIGQDYYNNPNYLGSGKLIEFAINKYGKQNFVKEILEFCDSKEHLNEREKFWIRYTDCQNLEVGYNLADGGSGGPTRRGHTNSEQMRENISKSKKGKPLTENHKKSLKGREFTNTHKENISKSKRGKSLTDSHKQKVSNSLKNREFTDEHKKKLSERGKGREFTNEHKKKLSERNITDEWRLKLSEAAKKRIGYVWINNGTIRTRIKKNELQNYLDSGWKLGRSIL